jgi:hypothetical protein
MPQPLPERNNIKFFHGEEQHNFTNYKNPCFITSAGTWFLTAQRARWK